MRRGWATAALLWACGGDPGASFSMSFGALEVPVSEFQVAVITDRTNVDCSQVTLGCVKDAFPATRFVELQDERGSTQSAVRFGGDGGTPVTTTVFMAPARDLAFVVEALSPESPPRLAGSGCLYVESINAGSNNVAMTLNVKADGGVVNDCDPRF
jgi:hypothetical protein